MSAVARRPGVRTALIVDIVDATRAVALPGGHPGRDAAHRGGRHGRRHLFLPGRWVSVQLQQPPAAALAAATMAHQAGARWSWTARRTKNSRDALLAVADVVRADAREAGDAGRLPGHHGRGGREGRG